MRGLTDFSFKVVSLVKYGRALSPISRLQMAPALDTTADMNRANVNNTWRRSISMYERIPETSDKLLSEVILSRAILKVRSIY